MGFQYFDYGAGKKAQNLVYELNHMQKSMGYKIIGYVRTDDQQECISSDLPIFTFSELSERSKNFL